VIALGFQINKWSAAITLLLGSILLLPNVLLLGGPTTCEWAASGLNFGIIQTTSGRRGNAARNTTRNASTGTGFSNAPARGFTHFNTHALA
jgi:hypothetical protein